MGIRDIILIGIIVGSLPLSVMRPFFGLLMFSWLAYMRPADMAWNVNVIRPSLLVAVATVLGVFFNKKERLLVLEKRTVLLGLFLGSVAVSSVLAIDSDLAWSHGYVQDLAKVVFIAMLTTGLVRTRDRARWLLIVIGGSLGLLALKSTVQWIVSPGFVPHGPGGMIGDNNDYGLALIMALPILAYLAREEKGPLLKAALAVLAVSCVAGVLLTQSRGGVIALAAVTLIWLFRLRRNPFALLMAPLCIALVLVLTPDSLLERFSSLARLDPDASSQHRMIAWEKAVSMGVERPVFGVGPGNFQAQWHNFAPETGRAAVVAHNTYLQLLAESGVVTLALFVVLFGITVIQLLRNQREGNDLWRMRYSNAVLLSLVGFFAGSVFLSRTHFDLAYHLVGISVALSVAGTGREFDWTFGWKDRRRENELDEPAGRPGGA